MRPRPTSNERLQELDGLRGLAILLVLYYHYFVLLADWPAGSAGSALKAATRLTWSGVDLFFVLSGFLIGGILLDQRGAGRFYSTFYARRFFRIVPLYLVVVASFFCARQLVGNRGGAAVYWLFGSPAPAVFYLTYTQNFWTALTGRFGPNWLSPTWSLAVEEQFYLLLPPLIRRVPPRLLPHVLLFFILLAPALRTLLILGGGEGITAAHVLMPCRADALLLGVLAAYMVRTARGWDWLLLHKRSLYYASSVLLAGAAAFTLLNFTLFTPLMSSLGYTWLAAFYLCLLLIAVAHPETTVGSFLRLKPLRQLGEVAYGTYLFHEALHGLYFWLLLGRRPSMTSLADVTLAVAIATLTILLARLSWRYFERPLLQRGKAFEYQEQAVP
jgi:peptidoglycan/LPS O-acetylase OafA/YrhL